MYGHMATHMATARAQSVESVVTVGVGVAVAGFGHFRKAMADAP